MLNIASPQEAGIDEAVGALADADARHDLAQFLADRLNLSASEILQLLGKDSDEPACVMCRAVGLRIEGYSAVLRMRRRARLGFSQSPACSLQAFRRLPREAAGSLVARLGPAASGRPAG